MFKLVNSFIYLASRPQLHNSKPRELKVEDALLYLDQVMIWFQVLIFFKIKRL